MPNSPEGDTSPAKDNPNSFNPEVESPEPLFPSLFSRTERSPFASNTPDVGAPNLLPKDIAGTAKELKPGQPAAESKEGDKPAEASNQAGDPLAGKVFTNKDGAVTDIEYPGGKKSRHIEIDPTTKEVSSVITKTPEATTVLNQNNGKWALSMQNLNLPVNGQIEVSTNGEVATKQPGSDVWKVEKTDGSIVDEKQSADGSRLRLSADGKPERLVRSDRSAVQQVNENKIVESRPGQKDVTWTKNGSTWLSDGQAAPRSNMKLENDGKLSFTDSLGARHEINSRGDETLEGDGQAKITADSLNRPKEVDMKDKVRKYEYFDDKSNDVKSVTIVNKKDNTSQTYSRENKETDKWAGTNWRGDISVGSDGVHSTRTHLNGQAVAENARWDSAHTDGRATTSVIGKDGSRTSFDKNSGDVVSVRTADGVRADKVGDTIKHYNPRIGEMVTWTKGQDGKFASNSPQFSDTRTNLGFTAKGELAYQNENKENVVAGNDGSKRVSQPDGTVLEYGADKQLQKAIRGPIERTFTNADGQVQKVVDRDTKTNNDKLVFDRKAAADANFTNVHLEKNGDLSYQTPDGGAVIERANGLRLNLDRDGDLSSVATDRGSRSFQYLGAGDTKALASISDSFKTDKGDYKETFSRVMNPDGSLANEFRSDKAGAASRFDLTPCADGAYEFTAKAGDKQILNSKVAR